MQFKSNSYQWLVSYCFRKKEVLLNLFLTVIPALFNVDKFSSREMRWVSYEKNFPYNSIAHIQVHLSKNLVRQAYILLLPHSAIGTFIYIHRHEDECTVIFSGFKSIDFIFNRRRIRTANTTKKKVKEHLHRQIEEINLPVSCPFT